MARATQSPDRGLGRGGVRIDGAINRIEGDIVGGNKFTVGAIVNAQHLHLVAPSGNGDDPPVSGQAILAASMVNRDRQIELLFECLEEQGTDQASAIAVILQGRDLDMHQAFVMRCAQIELLRRYGGADRWRYLQRLPWPETGGTVMMLLRAIRSRLGLPNTLDKTEIEAAIRAMPVNICFSHFIGEEDWLADNGALARAWLEYLGSNALRPAPGFRLVAFLCVEQRIPAQPRFSVSGLLERVGILKHPARRATKSLHRFVSELRDAVEDGEYADNLAVLPVLGAIKPRHVAEWTSIAGEFLKVPDMEGRLMTLPNLLFDGGATEHPYDYVFKIIQKELDRMLRSHTHFFELE